MGMPRVRSAEAVGITTDSQARPQGRTRFLIGWQGRHGVVAKLAIHAGILAARGKSLYDAFVSSLAEKGYCVGRIWLDSWRSSASSSAEMTASP